MDLVGDATRRLEHFVALWRLNHPRAKLLITGRPNFFLDDNERHVALRIDRAAAGRPYCEPVYLQAFALPQMRQALRKLDTSNRDEICALAERDRKFREVVERPSLLYMVSLIWTARAAGRSLRPDQLCFDYRYVHQSDICPAGGQSPWGPSIHDPDGPGACVFHAGGRRVHGANLLPNQISAEQLNELVEHLCDAIPDEVSMGPQPGPPQATPLRHRIKELQYGLDSVKTDVRSCGLLVDDLSKAGTFRFAHKSFMEYLVAESSAFPSRA